MTIKVLLRIIKQKILSLTLSVFGMFRYWIALLHRNDVRYDTDRTVVFLTEKAKNNFRLLRFVKWLVKECNLSVILISSDIKTISDIHDDYQQYFNEIFYFPSLWHLKAILKKRFRHTRLPFHVITPPSNIAKAVIQNTSNRVFYDPYDVRVIYFGPLGEGCTIPWMKRKWIMNDIPDEKYCFENASGHVCRSAENKTAIRKYHYQSKSPRLFMPDYCDPDSFKTSTIADSSSTIDTYHIVYVGGVSSIRAPKSFYNYMQLHNTITVITKQHIHFHIYYAPSQDEDLSDYAEIALANSYFHWHEPIPQSQLIQEISKYHFGIIPFFKEEMGNISPDKFFASTSLKLFNYLEAGIPVIVSKDLGHKKQIIDRYEMGLVIDHQSLNDLLCIIKSVNYAFMVGNVLKGREALSLKNNIHRLYNFYFHHN